MQIRSPNADGGRDAELPVDEESARWLDRASAAVENRLNRLGTSYLRTLRER